MQIYIVGAGEKPDESCAPVMTDAEGKLELGEVALTGGDAPGFYVNVGDWDDGSEDVCYQVCRTLVRFATENGIKGLALDIGSFVSGDANRSFVANTFIETFARIAGIVDVPDGFEVFLCGALNAESKWIAAFEKSEGSATINCSFGAAGDSLKDEFEKFQREVKPDVEFRKLLLTLVESKFEKDSHAYKASGVSKSVFSRITSFDADPPNMPSRETVAALCIGLRLELDEAEEFYAHAGFHLGKNIFVDRVIRFFIGKRIYDINEVNYCLGYYGHKPLGEKPREEKVRVHVK